MYTLMPASHGCLVTFVSDPSRNQNCRSDMVNTAKHRICHPKAENERCIYVEVTI